MSSRCLYAQLFVLAAAFTGYSTIGSTPALGGDSNSKSENATERRPDDQQANEVTRVAAEIDRLVAQYWTESSIVPTEPSDDAEYLRRVYLHISGCIPPVSVTREFLSDESPNKRRLVVERLLDEAGYIVNSTRYWRRAMLPETESDLQTRFVVPGFENWLREHMAANTPYDKLVREIINTPLENDNRNEYFARLQSSSPLAFYQAKQVAPENLAAATSRIFLGVQIECAQCHDHPFDAWKRDEFWSFAAFFAGIVRERQGDFVSQVREIPDRREIGVPDTDRVVQAMYLDGAEPRWRFRVGPRETLANWITSADNPYFARAAANRIWSQLFGLGIVEPIDDFSDANPPSHPELLDMLAREFVAHQFDLKFMIRVITATKTYQLTSRQTHSSQGDPRAFARMPLQGLTPEQLYDCLGQAAGIYRPFQPQAVFFSAQTPQGEFVETFAEEGASKIERETTILQSLLLMNGQQVSQAVSLESPRSTLGAIVESPFLDTKGKIESLYLTALCRLPTESELRKAIQYVEPNEATLKKDTAKALSDIFWALLNSTEFLVNH